MVVEMDVSVPKDKTLKGIFETLSRRKGRNAAANRAALSIPPPLPADYSPSQLPNIAKIVVSPDKIRPISDNSVITNSAGLEKDDDECDWGSEFSDSGSEAEDNSSLGMLTSADQDQSSAGYAGQSTSGSTTGDSMRAEEEGFEENIYELPDDQDHHQKVHPPVAPLRQVFPQPLSSPAQQTAPCRRSCSTDFTAMNATPLANVTGKNNSIAPRRNSSWVPSEKSTGSPPTTTKNALHAKEVAERLNSLLASRLSLAGSERGLTYATGCATKAHAGPNVPNGNSVGPVAVNGNSHNHILSRSISAGVVPASPDTSKPAHMINHKEWTAVNETDTYADTRERPQVPPKPKIFQERPVSDPLDAFLWFHGKIDRVETCRRLERTGTDGAFLVRRSLKGAEKFGSPYSLSLNFGGKVFHLVVRQRADKLYALGFEKRGEQAFSSVEEMIEFHHKNPIYLAECDKGVFLVMALTKAVFC